MRVGWIADTCSRYSSSGDRQEGHTCPSSSIESFVCCYYCRRWLSTRGCRAEGEEAVRSPRRVETVAPPFSVSSAYQTAEHDH